MKTVLNLGILLAVLGSLAGAYAQETRIHVQADQVLHPVSHLLTGACIEDVNHEIYGGIYSQMIFGESFQEPAPPLALKGFTAYGGRWSPQGDELLAEAGDGPKLICDEPPFTTGEASVEVLFPDQKGGNAGLIVKVSQPGRGADQFTGYEVALEPSGRLVLGRHRQNWEPIRTVPCRVPIKEWLTLTVRMTEKSLEVLLNGKSLTQFEDIQHPLVRGSVGLRTWQREARFRHLTLSTDGARRPRPFELAGQGSWGDGVSGMWRALRHGTAEGEFALEKQAPFAGQQSQRLTFTQGNGEVGVENQGLNRWGLYFAEGKSYDGYVWARAEKPTPLMVALESRDGSQIYAESSLAITGNGWQRLDFTLTASRADKSGRFALKLKQPGSVTLGHAFLQPGEWGRFKGLPVRRDVAEGLIAQGITLLRYGGSMINHPAYKWKQMIGPRDRRPPVAGTWYPHSSNGWGIPDFMDFCEAAGFEYVPAFNMGETPQDMADFIEYAKGPADSEWGRKRVADGHPAPYRLHYLELGNEERVDDKYAAQFEALAQAIWAKDPALIPIVGDFVYGRRIQDPFHFDGAASGITSLAGQQRILRFTKEQNREVWFDVHVGTDGPRPDASFESMFSFYDALDKIADGARHKVVVFEYNAGNHAIKRALANALATQAIERDGRLPMVTSANGLQPDGQNDNGWDQGLLFLNPSQVWLQPPGYVTRMISQNYQPRLVRSRVEGAPAGLDVVAKRSEDGKTLVLQVVNVAESATVAIQLDGFKPSNPTAHVEELAGALEARNPADDPMRVVPRSEAWSHGFAAGSVKRVFPAHSFTVIRFQ